MTRHSQLKKTNSTTKPNTPPSPKTGSPPPKPNSQPTAPAQSASPPPDPTQANPQNAELQRLAESLSCVEKELGRLPSHIALAFTVPEVKDAIRDMITEAVEAATKGLKNEIETLRDEIGRLHRKCNDLEQYDRRLNLVIHGIDESTKEDCVSIAADFFTTKIGVRTTAEDLHRCHRLGPPKKDKKPRPLIVRFVSYRLRQMAYRNKRRLKHTRLLLTENLTAHNMQLLQSARECKDFESSWTVDGLVHVLFKGRINIIREKKDIDELANRFRK